jgi:hypothetical protein
VRKGVLMPKALNKYIPGTPIILSCPNDGCENTPASKVILDKEDRLHPDFSNLKRLKEFKWHSKIKVKIFHLKSHYCQNCKTSLSYVLIISAGQFKKPLIFGYNSDLI